MKRSPYAKTCKWRLVFRIQKTLWIRQLQVCTVSGQKGSFARFLVELASRQNGYLTPPGSIFNYSSGDAVLNGLIAERATGISPPIYMQEKIWQPFGMEQDSYWSLEAEDGRAFTASG